MRPAHGAEVRGLRAFLREGFVTELARDDGGDRIMLTQMPNLETPFRSIQRG
jgi:hypothetical protein